LFPRGFCPLLMLPAFSSDHDERGRASSEPVSRRYRMTGIAASFVIHAMVRCPGPGYRCS
jgi:hypothetical protein